MMIRPRRLLCALTLLAAAAPAGAQTAAPRDNPYDVIGKVLQPFWSILLVDSKTANHAAQMTIRMSGVSGRLPKQFEGATLKAAVQFPDKLKLEAPVMGEQFTVCRNGDEVWATPGEKVRFLLDQFKIKPDPLKKKSTPLTLPVTAQQAVFLPALFSIKGADVAEVDSLGGEDCRIITGGLMPELGKVTKSEDFQARLWVAAGYVPRRVDIIRRDFTATVDISDLRFSPTLPEATWQVPAGATDVYRTTPEYLEQVLFVVVNSLQMKSGDTPWQHVR